MSLVFTDESTDKLKQYEELWNKIRDIIISITSNSDNYDGNYFKIKFYSDVDLPLKKMLKLYSMVIVNQLLVVRSAFHECNKYYPQVFLNECKNVNE